MLECQCSYQCEESEDYICPECGEEMWDMECSFCGGLGICPDCDGEEECKTCVDSQGYCPECGGSGVME